MGKYGNVYQEPRHYSGPTCEARSNQRNADGSETCNLPAQQHVNGLHLCFGHAEIARLQAATTRLAQAAAADWCASRGLNTPDAVRDEASRLANIPHAGMDREWAKRIAMRLANGESVPQHAVDVAASVAPPGYFP